MTNYTLSPIWGAGAQLFDSNGDPLTGGKIYTYAAGSTTPAPTYTGPTGAAFNSNPIILDAAGRPPNEIWLSVGYSLKFVLKDANDVLIKTYENIPTLPQPPIVNDSSSISYNAGFVVDAGSFTVGVTYLINTVGSTDFMAIGAAANLTGVMFTATGPGSGTGDAYFVRTVQERLRDMLDVKDFGAIGDGVTDDTVAIQAALDNGVPFTLSWGSYLVTDTLTIDATLGCTIIGEARTVPNTVGFPRLIFQPATKRDVFTWKSTPATYAFAGVQISGLAVRGEGPGAAAVFNLPRLYRGNIDAYIYSGIDHYAIIEKWLDCNVSGNINGFRVSAFKITNSTLSGGNITSRTDFDVYISGGEVGYTTYGFDIETFSIIGGKITNMIESVDCAIRMARGNTIDSTIYTENTPRTNAGALFESGKIDTGTPDGTTVFSHFGVNLHGTNAAAPGYSATIFADIDYCSSFSIVGADIKRFGALLKTTANSKNISFTDCYAIGVDLIEPTITGIADFNELTFSSFRPVQMFSAHGNLFQYTNVATTAHLNPQGLVRPRWAYDRLYSTTSLSFWTSAGDGLFDWRLAAPEVFTGSDIVTTPVSIVAGGAYQADVTVYGALTGDFAVASCGGLGSGLAISARVTAADTVTVTLTNATATTISFVNVTLRVLVTKAMV